MQRTYSQWNTYVCVMYAFVVEDAALHSEMVTKEDGLVQLLWLAPGLCYITAHYVYGRVVTSANQNTCTCSPMPIRHLCTACVYCCQVEARDLMRGGCGKGKPVVLHDCTFVRDNINSFRQRGCTCFYHGHL